MKTPEQPRSSNGKGKDEESAPRGEEPMERFRSASIGVLGVAPDKVKAAEAAERTARKKPKKP